MKSFLSIGISPALLALPALLLMSGCSNDTENATGKTALTVTLVTPASSSWAEQITASGSVAAWQESIIGAEVGGLKLEEVLVNVGDKVRKGQLLARFNDETTRADLAQTEASVAEAEANLAVAKDKAERARRLDGSGTISNEDLLQYEANNKIYAAQLDSAKAKLDAQRITLRNTQVLAPDDGLISSRTATVGAVLSSGSELFKLIRQSRLEWRADIPSDRLASIVAGQEVSISQTGLPDVTGKVRQISPLVDGETLTGKIYVDLPDPGTLKAGMFVSGKIKFANSPALHLPETTLVYRDGYQYLMKVDATRKVHQLKVTTGRRLGDEVEILTGVAADDQIAANGGSFLNEGDSVLVVTAETAAASAASENGGRQ